MSIFNPLFDIIEDRPRRWLIAYGNNSYEYAIYGENRYIHYTEKSESTLRNVYAHTTEDELTLKTHRYHNVGFLTTYYDYSYEDGKYAEVRNDALNYISADPTTTSIAYTQAEARIGNYRKGARRDVLHLGGTLDAEELDTLKDKQETPVALTSLPLMPPLPPSDYVKVPRVQLVTSDVGFVKYTKAAHPEDTVKYAFTAEQGTGFRRFIYDAGNTAMKSKSTSIISHDLVQIQDLESVIDTSLAIAITGTPFAKQFLPEDGEDLIINIAGNHVIKSTSTGYKIEMYDSPSFGTLLGDIVFNTDGDIILSTGSNVVTLDNDGDLVLTNGTRTITIGATVDVT